MKKTFKIGEYVIGGIIEVVSNKETITINFRDYFSKDIVVTNTFAIGNSNVTRQMQFFLEDNGTAYYADKVMDYIKDNVELPKTSGLFGW